MEPKPDYEVDIRAKLPLNRPSLLQSIIVGRYPMRNRSQIMRLTFVLNYHWTKRHNQLLISPIFGSTVFVSWDEFTQVVVSRRYNFKSLATKIVESFYFYSFVPFVLLFKWAFPGLFSSFSMQLTVNIQCKFCRWLDSNHGPLDWKRPLYQLSRNHWPRSICSFETE